MRSSQIFERDEMHSQMKVNTIWKQDDFILRTVTPPLQLRARSHDKYGGSRQRALNAARPSAVQKVVWFFSNQITFM